MDAALCGTRSADREAYSIYPDEPILFYDATLFVRADSPLADSQSGIIAGSRFAVVKGYSFGDVDAELVDAGMNRLEAKNREALVKLLLAGRVDAVLESQLPMLEHLSAAGVAGELRALEPALDETPGYLMFSRREGHETLTQEFSAALAAFKQTPEYQGIVDRYQMR